MDRCNKILNLMNVSILPPKHCFRSESGRQWNLKNNTIIKSQQTIRGTTSYNQKQSGYKTQQLTVNGAFHSIIPYQQFHSTMLKICVQLLQMKLMITFIVASSNVDEFKQDGCAAEAGYATATGMAADASWLVLKTR